MRIVLVLLFCLQLAGCAIPPVFNFDNAKVKEALNAGADPNEKWAGTRPLAYQINPTRLAHDPYKIESYGIDPDEALANVRLLLQAGANPNEPQNQPPLYQALTYCLADIAKELLDAGADPHAMAYGDVPMPLALAPGSHCPTVDDQYRITRVVLDHLEQKEGRDAMLRYVRMDGHNYSLLHIAAWQKFYGVLAALIEKRVDLDPQIKAASYWQQTALEMYCTGCTPLHLAEGVGHADIADALRRAGARDDIINALGVTPTQFRQYLVPVASTAEKLAGAANVGQMYATGNLIGLLKKDIEGGMALEIYRKAQNVDKGDDMRRWEGGPVHPPQGWQGLEKATARALAQR